MRGQPFDIFYLGGGGGVGSQEFHQEYFRTPPQKVVSPIVTFLSLSVCTILVLAVTVFLFMYTFDIWHEGRSPHIPVCDL